MIFFQNTSTNKNKGSRELFMMTGKRKVDQPLHDEMLGHRLSEKRSDIAARKAAVNAGLTTEQLTKFF